MSDKPVDYLKQKTVRQIAMKHFKNPKSKISAKPLKYLTAAINAVIIEAILRAANQTFAEGESEINCDILEKVIPQLCLDM